MSKLILVPTPVGNLEDMTFRAVNVLKEVTTVLAEDTRTSGKLLRHYGIETRMMSFHMHNEHRLVEQIIGRIRDGEEMALITDAGTPGISDPGFLLVREAVKNNIEVDCLPGPTAFVPALVVSGIPCDRFCFEGFLPVKKGRQTRIKELATESRTIVLYESPHRLLKAIREFKAEMGEDRQAAAVREISKKFGEAVRGTLAELEIHFTEHEPRGEFVLVLAGSGKESKGEKSA